MRKSRRRNGERKAFTYIPDLMLITFLMSIYYIVIKRKRKCFIVLFISYSHTVGKIYLNDGRNP